MHAKRSFSSHVDRCAGLVLNVCHATMRVMVKLGIGKHTWHDAKFFALRVDGALPGRSAKYLTD